jgi:hypothetical protein
MWAGHRLLLLQAGAQPVSQSPGPVVRAHGPDELSCAHISRLARTEIGIRQSFAVIERPYGITKRTIPANSKPATETVVKRISEITVTILSPKVIFFSPPLTA